MLTVTNVECHTKTPYAECHYAEFRYAECRYADYRGSQKYSENLLRSIFTLKLIFKKIVRCYDTWLIGNQHNDTPLCTKGIPYVTCGSAHCRYTECQYGECHYSESHYGECHCVV
jgi:hypothetical protein